MNVDHFNAKLKQNATMLVAIGLIIVVVELVPQVSQAEVLDTNKTESIHDSAIELGAALSLTELESDSAAKNVTSAEASPTQDRVVKILIFVALFLFGGFMTHCALCLIAGPNADAARGKRCNDCCFGQSEMCSLPKPWSIPYRIVKSLPIWLQALCPFCYHYPHVGRDHAISEISKNYNSRLGAALLGLVGAAVGGFVAYLKLVD